MQAGLEAVEGPGAESTRQVQARQVPPAELLPDPRPSVTDTREERESRLLQAPGPDREDRDPMPSRQEQTDREQPEERLEQMSPRSRLGRAVTGRRLPKQAEAEEAARGDIPPTRDTPSPRRGMGLRRPEPRRAPVVMAGKAMEPAAAERAARG